MSIASDVSALKDLSDDVVANKVSRFAYTEQAYTDNDADGVTEYDVNADQNIPVGTASIMKVNQTVIEKGWRSRASSITRMLMNHFLGRISYNLNKVNDWFNSFLGSMSSYLGAPNGIATLDQDGRIPYSQLPESAIELKGYWDANTNTPALADGTGTNGDEYIVSVAGTRDLGSGAQYFGVGDRILYTSGVWKNISSGFVKKVSDVQPDAQGNVDLTQQTDTHKVLSTNILLKLSDVGIHFKKQIDLPDGNPNLTLFDRNLTTVNGKLFYSQFTSSGADTKFTWCSPDCGKTWQLVTVPSLYEGYSSVVSPVGYDDTLQKYIGLIWGRNSEGSSRYAVGTSTDGLTWVSVSSVSASNYTYLGKLNDKHWFQQYQYLYYTDDLVTLTSVSYPTPSPSFVNYKCFYEIEDNYMYCSVTSVAPSSSGVQAHIDCFKSENPISGWGNAFYTYSSPTTSSGSTSISITSPTVFRGVVYAYQVDSSGANKKLFASNGKTVTTSSALPNASLIDGYSYFNKSVDNELLFFRNKLVYSADGSGNISFGEEQAVLPSDYYIDGVTGFSRLSTLRIFDFNGIYVYDYSFSTRKGTEWKGVVFKSGTLASQYTELGARKYSETVKCNNTLYCIRGKNLYKCSLEDLVD